MKRLHLLIVGAGALLLMSGCASLQRSAMSGLSASLAEGAAMSFGRESDLELAAEAMPFALKTLDMLALENPGNPDIQLAASRGYITYAGAFLDWEARKIETTDLAAAQAMRERAYRLHLRGRDYAAAALSLSHPNALDQLTGDAVRFLGRMDKSDVPALFWLGVGWAAAMAAQPAHMDELVHLPVVEAVMKRALALDPDYNGGSIHEFFIIYEGSRGTASGGDPSAADRHFQNALTASKGRLASPYVSLATSAAIQQQDRRRFRELLEKALAIDPDAAPDFRLANTLAREKAAWYLERADDFFLAGEGDPP